MPKSYLADDNYFDGIDDGSKIPPGQKTQATMIPQCNHQVIQPADLDAYQFESERYITSAGLNIYDGACWSMAMALLGEDNSAVDYEDNYINQAKTCQFADNKGDKACDGVIILKGCEDPDQIGKCGFCYGSGPNQTLDKSTAWTFKYISDYWAFANTVDLRCPELNLNWIWNDYKPVLGENAWANIIGPIQVAHIRYGGADKIPDNDLSISLATSFVRSLPQMKVPQIGGLFYSPMNTLADPTHDLGITVSTENNISVLAALKQLLVVLNVKNLFPEMLGTIKSLIDNIEQYIKSSYDPTLGYFRQGGTVDPNSIQFTWETGKKSFAVDCQTWAITVLGPKKIDSWFGAGTSKALWKTTKKLGGYHFNEATGSADGVGYSVNSDDQAFSGEWTFGAINMLRVLARDLGDKSYLEEANAMRQNIEDKLTDSFTIGDSNTVTAVKYANKRYYIPFGWFANPIASTASTSWAVFVDSNFNPFHLGGNYTSDY